MDLEAFKRELFNTAWSMQRTLHEVMAPLCQRHGLTIQQLHVLMELSRTPGVKAGQLSDSAGILRTNFASMCRKLEERGLIERRRSEQDKRSLELRVTDKGKALLAAVDEDVRRRYDTAFQAEPQETFETITAGLDALNGFVRKLGR